MLRAYPGATSKILAANKSQPALYGPYVTAFIHNPPTIQDQGIRHIISESIVNQDEFIGQMASVAFTWSGLDAVSTQMLNALAMAGFALLELSDGSLLATRWNLSRPLPDTTAALRFLRQIGGAA